MTLREPDSAMMPTPRLGINAGGFILTKTTDLPRYAKHFRAGERNDDVTTKRFAMKCLI